MFRPSDSSCHPHRLFLIIIESYTAVNGMQRITLSPEDSGDTVTWLVRRTLQKSHVGQAERNNIVVLTRTPGPVIWITGDDILFWHTNSVHGRRKHHLYGTLEKLPILPPWSWFPPAWRRQNWQNQDTSDCLWPNFLQPIGLTVSNDALGNIRDTLGFQVTAVL